MVYLYNIGIRIYFCLIWLASFFSPKAQKWIKGRIGWRQKLRAFSSTISSTNKVVWVHCASLGEFEQGRPVIESIKGQFPEVKILLTFFSPSGYEIRQHYPHADGILYLPLDTAGNADFFIKTLKPDITIFIKYEFWYHFITQLSQKGVEVLLVSSIFRPNQLFFKPYGGLFRKILASFDWIFVQESGSHQLLRSIGLKQCSIGGDTRVDRVAQIARAVPRFPAVTPFKGSAPIFIAGSTWPKDEEILLPFLKNDLPVHWKIILAPHQIHPEHIAELVQRLPQPCIPYSQIQGHELSSCRTIVIDNIGILSGLYQFGNLAYIGGGFGEGIHNILEPMTFGLPVIFGPKYQKFREAREMITAGGSYSIDSREQLQQSFHQLMDPNTLDDAGSVCLQYIEKNRGATQKILDFLAQHKLV